jgi:hypothetical protein
VTAAQRDGPYRLRHRDVETGLRCIYEYCYRLEDARGLRPYRGYLAGRHWTTPSMNKVGGAKYLPPSPGRWRRRADALQHAIY